jgi:transcriptional regulator with XRE-family HTH domain
MKTADYIRAIKEKHGYTSDYAVAKALGVTRQQISQWVNGKNVPSPLIACRIAYILSEQPAAVVADLERERAEKMGKDADVAEWTAVIKKIGGGAASILLAAGLAGFACPDANLAHSSSADSLYIV